MYVHAINKIQPLEAIIIVILRLKLLVVLATGHNCPDALFVTVLETKLVYFLLECLHGAIATAVTIESSADV